MERAGGDDHDRRPHTHGSPGLVAPPRIQGRGLHPEHASVAVHDTGDEDDADGDGGLLDGAGLNLFVRGALR